MLNKQQLGRPKIEWTDDVRRKYIQNTTEKAWAQV
jgi:hypothetical protein